MSVLTTIRRCWELILPPGPETEEPQLMMLPPRYFTTITKTRAKEEGMRNVNIPPHYSLSSEQVRNLR